MLGIVTFVAACVAHVSGSDCPLGWFVGNNSCYLFPRGHASSFTEAEHYCQQHLNSHLVQVETAAENAFIKEELRALKAEYHWLGLTDEQSEGTFRWYSGGAVPTFTDWALGEPNDLIDEDCVVFDYFRDYTWTDVRCGRSMEPICELNFRDEVITVG